MSSVLHPRQPSSIRLILSQIVDVSAVLMGWWTRSLRAVALVLVLALAAGAAQAAPDLRITSYSWAPDPVLLASPSTFSVRVNNLGTNAASAGQITIAIPSNILVTSGFPAYCALSGSAGAQSLVCNLPAILDGAELIFTYDGAGRAVGSAAGGATVTAQGSGTSSISPTVIVAADLSLTLTPSATTLPAGDTLTYTAVVTNGGPSASGAVRARFNIPPSGDFSLDSATGTSWTCTTAGTLVTCTYSGPAQTGNYPPILISGRVVKAIAGTISANGSVDSTDVGIGDGNVNNNATPNIVVSISPGTDLAAGKSMPAAIVNGSSANILLQINNLGPQATPAGARIVDTIPAGLTIGVMPPGCLLSGRTVACTAGAISDGGNQAFIIPVTGNTLSSGNITNTATVSPPNSLLDPISGNNSASASYQVVPPSTDLSLQKSKSPNPVAANSNITSTMTITNNGPSVTSYSPTNPLKITDTLSPGETYISTVTAGWSCSVLGNVVTCETTGSGSISAPQTSPSVVPGGTQTLEIITRSGAAVDTIITNTACTGSSAGSANTPSDPNTANDCASAGVRATTANADLQIIKEISLSSAGPWTQASLASPLQVTPTDDSYYIRLRVRNNNLAGGDTARTVEALDSLPNYMNQSVDDGGVTVLHRSTVSLIGTVVSGTCSIPAIGGSIGCTLTDLVPQEERIIILRVQRALISGPATNTASIFSPDTAEANTANNASSAFLNVAPISDITVTSKTVNPNPSLVGTAITYTLSVKNLGPNEADNVILTDIIDTTRFELIAGSVATTKPGVTSCDFASGDRVTCEMGTFLLGQVFQTSFQVRARFPFAGSPSGPFPVSNSNTAAVTTTTTEIAGGAANNARTLVHDVIAPTINLGITKVEPSAAFDPIIFGDQLAYDVRVSNTGLSRATGIVMTDIPNPPAGFTMTFASFQVNPAGVSATGGGTLITPQAPNCVVVGATIECRLHSSIPAQSFLDNRQQVVFRLFFDTAGTPPATTLTFSNSANVIAREQTQLVTNENDLDLANNVAVQTTFALPRVDLEVLNKTLVTASPADIGQPLTYTIQFRNNGPSTTTQVRILDQLPAGFGFVSGNAVTDTGSSVVISGTVCTTGASPTCTINGSFPVGGANTATLTLIAVPLNPYTGPIGVAVTNTATILIGLDANGDPLARDPTASNNTKTADAILEQASLSGRVYSDANNDNVVDPGEGVGSVTITLRAPSGVDANGTPFPDRVLQTNADGTFNFDKLPPGTFILIETQPTNLADANEIAGTAGGTPGPTFTTSQISAITLPAGGAATGYIFRELPLASVSGFVYRDTNNNGLREAGEIGFATGAFPSGPHLRLVGTDFSGTAVSLTVSVDANGFYEFLGVRPSDSSGYRLEQIVAPTGTLDGSEQNGTGVAVAASGGRALAAEIISLGVVAQGTTFIERNLGELLPATLSGVVFLDTNSDATRQSGETGRVPNATLRLTGTNDLGQAIDCSVNTDGVGAYSFGNAADANPLCQALRPGTYQVQPTQIGGLSPIGVFIGTAGGTSGATTGANQPVVGAQIVSAITLTAGQSGTNYDFGGAGQGLSGSVYADRNNNGIRDAGEAGIPGVTITLSGTTSGAQSVCTIITCAAVTDSSGTWRFPTVPASNATGYTLTEQAQASAPLSAFGDGIDRAGEIGATVAGVAGNDVITGIVMPTNGFGVNYNFGERSALIAGTVFVDLGADGVLSLGDPGLAGVVVTLSGTTSAGQDICTYLAALNPALSCNVTTGSDGSYAFANLPAGTYAITQTQPALFADGRDTAGTSGGSVSATNGSSAGQNTISAITLSAGAQASGNNFGELGASVSGAVYGDIDNSGTRNVGDSLINGTIITLSGLTSAGTDVCAVLTAQVPSRSCTITTVAGLFSFVGLPSGTYTLTQTQPAGYADGAETAGPAGGTPSDNRIAGIVLATGASAPDNFFGELLTSISGVVYVDRDANGAFSIGETPLQGVSIRLTGTDAQGQAVDVTAITGPDGRYSFPNLVGGTYNVTQTQPAAYGNGTPNIVAVTLAGGTSATADFGELDGGLSGSAYVDADRSGARNGTEIGLEGVGITLSGATLDGRDICAVLAALTPAGTCSATTGAGGAYSFTRVPAGTYVLTQTQPIGYADGPENPGTSGGVPTDNVISAISLAPGITSTANNFGELVGAITGQVFVDANGNVSPDATERPVVGVLITLTGTDIQGRPVNLTATTGADGTYSFPNLVGGNYTITQTQPGAYANGSPNVVAITLPSGGAASANFAELAGGLSGGVYKDLNNDGSRQTTEPGISGVTITLSGNTSDGIDVCTLITCTRVTGPDGAYAYIGLPAGTYTLTQTQPAGYADGAATAGPAGGTPSANRISGISLTSGASAPDNLFGEVLSSISGVVYVDRNGNGLAGADETALAGVIIRLTGTDAQGQPADVTVTTGPNGRYSFPNLVGGSYTVTQTQPNDYGNATPNVVAVTLVGGTPASVDFGEVDGGLSGSVYVDADRNGTRNGTEPGLPGVTLTLSGTTSEGRDICTVLAGLVPAGSCTATTGANGTYAFTRLPAGTYRVIETQPAGYADGPENAGTTGGTTSDNIIAGITVTPGLASSDNNFGELIGGVTGRVYVDANGDTLADATERSVSGVIITLTGTDDQGRPVNLTATTGADGTYRFPNLVGGNYTITQTQPNAYANGSPNVVAITLPSGGASTANFAELAGGLSGAVYRDLNKDGARQTGETGIAGVTVTLSGRTADNVDICTLVTCTTTTATDGSYSFIGLPSGTYTVTETQPVGYADGATTAGPAGGVVTNNAISGIILAGGANAPGNLFAEQLASIGGIVYIDNNADKAFTAGESGVPSVTIRLTGTDILGNVVDVTTTSGPDGRYNFPNLLSGSYTVTQTQPDGLVSSTPNVVPVILVPGATVAADFGELQRSLTGTVFVDRDRDGVNDAGEGRLGGITIRLFNAAGVLVGTTQTAADGTYRFEGLAPGAYTVEQVQPQGYGSSTPNRVAVTIGMLADSQIDFGETLVAVNGVVYDALVRTPVPSAVVVFTGPVGFDPAIHLDGGAPAGRIVTSADGLYAFRLLPSAPVGDYRLTVTPPATGYSPVWPSKLIVPCAQTLVVPTNVLITTVQTNGTAPTSSAATSCNTGGQTTAYFPSLRLVPGSSSDVANNHLPIDPVLSGLLRVTKATPQTLVTRGGLVAYTISVTNSGTFAIPGVEVIDRLPAGFAYRVGTAQVDGVNTEPVVRAGRELVWGGLIAPTGQTRSISFVLAVGANAREGDHVNQALAGIIGSTAEVSNIAEATVRLMPDVDFDCTDVIGKVFDDRNGNGRQDEGEPGLAGVRVATPTGLLITTDAEGRYHIPCIVVPNNERGSNVAIKLDVRTLPTGYRITTENPEVVRATRGRVIRVNFGAALMQVIRIDMDHAVFKQDRAEDPVTLTPAFDQALLDLVPTLEASPSVVRLAYTQRAGETVRTAQNRLQAVSRRLEDVWNDKKNRYRLIVETEVMSGVAQ